MHKLTRHWGRLVMLGVAVVVASCAHMGGNKHMAGGVEINDVDMGRTADSTNISITDVTHDFKPNETVYATVKYHNTTNDNATLNVKWYRDANVLGEESGTLLPGEHASLFRMHVDNPLQPGDYKFEIYVNGTLIETKKFTVKAA